MVENVKIPQAIKKASLKYKKINHCFKLKRIIKNLQKNKCIPMFLIVPVIFFIKIENKILSGVPIDRNRDIFYIMDLLVNNQSQEIPFKSKYSRDTSKFNITYMMPIYNKNHFLNSCLTYLYTQTDKDFEMIFVDDGSTDGSFETIWNRTKNDKRVSIVRHNYNRGTYAGRASAILHSRTKYVIEFDVDDIIESTAVERMNNFLRKDQEDIDAYEIQCDYIFKTKYVANSWPCRINISQAEYYLFDYINRQKIISANNIWKRLTKRSIFLKTLFVLEPFTKNKKLTFCEDALIVTFSFCMTHRLVCSNVKLYYYVRQLSGSSLTYQTDKQRLLQIKYSSLLNLFIRETPSAKYYIDKYRMDDLLNSYRNWHRYDEIQEVFHSISNIQVKPSIIKCSGDSDTHKFIDLKDEDSCLITWKE